MTFSLVVPLSFYLYPAAYAMIVIVADVVMLSITMSVAGSVAPLINISIFAVFQLVLGTSFLRLRLNLSERIVEAQENADIDVMTGFPNRRVYNEDMKRLAMEPRQDDLVYISIDVNGLKEVNDALGHEAGDRLIVGASECIEQGFGPNGKLYRIGGDEFVVIINANQDELILLFNSFENSLKKWSDRSGIVLTAAYGYVFQNEHPDSDINTLARLADERMYSAKARYYQESGRDRRGAGTLARV